jgi:hypothetical protein
MLRVEAKDRRAVKAVEIERRERVARKAALVVRGNFMVLCCLDREE